MKVSFLLLFLCLISSMPASALNQAEQEQLHIDSIKAVLEKSNQNTARVSLMNKIAAGYFKLDPASAYNYASEALELSKEIGDRFRMAQSYSMIAKSYVELSKLELARVNYEQALALYQNTTNRSGKEMNSSNEMAMASIHLDVAVTHILQSQYETALAKISEALKVYRKVARSSDKMLARKASIGIATSNMHVGRISCYQGDYHISLDYLSKSLLVFTKHDAQNRVGECQNHIGKSLEYQGNFPGALSAYMKALQIFRRLGDDRRTAFELKNAGTIYEYSGDYDSAEDFHNEALEMQREMNDQKGIMSTCQRLGAIKMSREHYKAATNYFKTSLDIAIQLNNHYQAGMIQQYIAQTEERQKHYELAVAEYLAAEQYFVQANTPQKIYLSYFNIARTYLKQGNYGQAESFIDKCIALTEEGIAVSLMANIYNMQGLIQSKSGNLALAVQSFNKSIQSATESGDLVHMATTYQDLSNTYSLASDFKGALTAYKTFSTLKDSLFNEDKSKEIGKLEAKHEFDTAELERKRVEREQLKRKVAEQSRRDNLQYSGILIFLVLLFAGLFMLGRISIPLWLAEGMIFFSFLLFFEFTLVLLDPLIEDYSLGAPAIKLGLNSILAALIFPLHAFFEERIKTRLSN